MISEKAKRLILEFEGMDQPGHWPGGSSGITIGHGYDLGYVTKEQFEIDWRWYLSAEQMERLDAVIGMTGQRAKMLALTLSDIKIRLQDADSVFTESSIPKFEDITYNAFPGIENLPEDARGALVSLVYNRGSDCSNTDRRREMFNIRNLVSLYQDAENKNDILQQIADQIRLMKRLWEGQGLGGLLRRRDAEAALVESCKGGEV